MPYFCLSSHFIQNPDSHMHTGSSALPGPLKLSIIIVLFASIFSACFYCVLTDSDNNEDEIADESETESEHGKDKKNSSSVAATACEFCRYKIELHNTDVQLGPCSSFFLLQAT